MLIVQSSPTNRVVDDTLRSTLLRPLSGGTLPLRTGSPAVRIAANSIYTNANSGAGRHMWISDVAADSWPANHFTPDCQQRPEAFSSRIQADKSDTEPARRQSRNQNQSLCQSPGWTAGNSSKSASVGQLRLRLQLIKTNCICPWPWNPAGWWWPTSQPANSRTPYIRVHTHSVFN